VAILSFSALSPSASHQVLDCGLPKLLLGEKCLLCLLCDRRSGWHHTRQATVSPQPWPDRATPRVHMCTRRCVCVFAGPLTACCCEACAEGTGLDAGAC
jgi:hypothetical protein